MSGLQDTLGLFERLRAAGRLTSEEEQIYYRLRDLEVNRVDFVPRGANKRRFAVVKQEGDSMTFPNNDDGLGPAVVATDDGGFVVTDDPQDIAKAAIPGPLKASLLQKIGALLKKVEGADSGPPGMEIPPEFGRDIKAISDMLMAKDSSGPKPASPGGEEKDPMKKESDPNAVDLDGAIIDHGALVGVAKAGRRMKGATLDKFKTHMAGLQDILRHAEQNPGDAMAAAISEAMAPVAKAFTDSAEKQAELIDGFMALVKKSLGEEADADQDPDAQPDGDKKPVAKDADAPAPAAKPAPVPAGQAKPAAAAPVAKSDEVGWSDVCGVDINDEDE